MNDDVRIALEQFAARKREFWANPSRGQCPWCKADDVILQVSPTHAGDPAVCATCAGKRGVEARDSFEYPCDDCGEGPSFRDPLGREDIMRCPTCHAKAGYTPGSRAMMMRDDVRTSSVHKLARREQCVARGKGTECGGQTKPRGSLGVICDKHFDPKKFGERGVLNTPSAIRLR